MTKRVLLRHEGNLGYGSDQIETNMTLNELLEAVQDAIAEWGEDAIVVTHQTNNRYGANYGAISSWATFGGADPEDEEDEE